MLRSVSRLEVTLNTQSSLIVLWHFAQLNMLLLFLFRLVVLMKQRTSALVERATGSGMVARLLTAAALSTSPLSSTSPTWLSSSPLATCVCVQKSPRVASPPSPSLPFSSEPSSSSSMLQLPSLLLGRQIRFHFRETSL